MADWRLENIETYSKYFKKGIESNATSSHYRLLKENLLSPILKNPVAFKLSFRTSKSLLSSLCVHLIFLTLSVRMEKKTFVRQEKQIEIIIN